MVEKFFYTFLSIPLLVALIWVYFHPNESGEKYKEPRFSKDVVKFITGILIFIQAISISLIFDNYFFRIVLVLGLSIFILYNLIKLYRK
ncbi:hypothetical protein SAMN05192533_10811 [Mesobacillus persicus]|uniref:YtpI-like protein n=1 Tax=Mesobacillus persicus TaxID=930146 RepID=A0A1H8D1H1_9BACI|nr:hypothetical protein SAMN05192533_10811 [Mesobacillus persicus]